MPGSIAERFIATYAKKGSPAVDAETAEQLALAGMESNAMVEQQRGDAADYFRETSAYWRRSWPSKYDRRTAALDSPSEVRITLGFHGDKKRSFAALFPGTSLSNSNKQ